MVFLVYADFSNHLEMGHEKSYRVKKEAEFQEVFTQGKSCANRMFVVYMIEKPEQKHFRVGISVGKRSGMLSRVTGSSVGFGRA